MSQREEEYQPANIESAAQAFWDRNRSFEANEDSTKKKFYCLSMFPYPSGKLHIGHVRNYTIGDVIARYQRHLGKNVLQPMGWDAFGLPAENAALATGNAPEVWTKQNIAEMKAQLKRLGFSYDWRREFATMEDSYYRWEQWLFTKLMAPGVTGGAYQKNATVNWDPVDQTVLANEQVVEGRGWRSGALVEKKEIMSWYFRITDYAEDLLESLDDLSGWPEEVKTMQRHWIGKSVGTTITFRLTGRTGDGAPLVVYTTRADTLFGVSYLACAPNHPLARQITDQACLDFINTWKQGSTREADTATIKKEGVRIPGVSALHPLTKQQLPIYLANYIVMDYGTGAVMAVPAHDQRDYEFACTYGLPIQRVVDSGGDLPDTQDGVLCNSLEYTGLRSPEARVKITEALVAKGLGEAAVSYRLRDWGVSRQRYWGCPIPVVYGPNRTPHPADTLPVSLPIGKPADSVAQNVEAEADTFDTFVESSWYHARFASYDCTTAMLDQRANYWLPVDQYIGGVEHAVMHLLYARFFQRLLRDAGLVVSKEPFTNLLTQGMVIAPTFKKIDKDGNPVWVNRDDVIERSDGGYQCRLTGDPILYTGKEKMSKSKNNGVDPQALIDRYGSDALRMYIIFAAPPEQQLEWSASALEGCYRFLKRVHALAVALQGKIATAHSASLKQVPPSKRKSAICQAIQKALFDYQRKQFNTVVSSAMILYNEIALERKENNNLALIAPTMRVMLLLLSPIVPHLTHALYRQLGFGDDISFAPWPNPDDYIAEADTIPMVVQVFGKKKGVLSVAPGTSQEAVLEAIANNSSLARFTQQKVIKVIFVRDRLINLILESPPNS